MLRWLVLVTATVCFADTKLDKLQKPRFTLTLILNFEDEYVNPSLASMESELNELLRPIGIVVETRLRREIGSRDVFERLVVVDFNGSCHANQQFQYMEAGPLGMVLQVDGEILPFINVYCGQIHHCVRDDLRREKEMERTRKFGRAMARVVAHELYHVFSQSSGHTKSGITKAGFDAGDLLADRLKFDKKCLHKMLNSRELDRASADGRRAYQPMGESAYSTAQ